MSRSTKASWLDGPGDLKETDVEDVPIPGASVRVRALSAKYSAEVQGQLKMVTEGRSQVARIDVAAMERLQFLHGVVDPEFTPEEVGVIQERYGAAFRKVVEAIQEISGIDKEGIETTERQFRSGGTNANGTTGEPAAAGMVDEASAGVRGSDVHARAGA